MSGMTVEQQGSASLHGVYRIPDMGYSNAYLVEIDQQGLILIDTGTPGKDPKIQAQVTRIGRKPGDIQYIVLTHADADHSGSAARMKSITGGKLAIGELDAPRISGEVKELKEVSGLGSVMVGLFGSFMKVERVKADILLKDGDTVGPLRVIHTPGHTDGSISLYKPGEAIFVGDLLRTDANGKLKLASAMMSRDMSRVRRSVEKLSELEFSMLLPGHGNPLLSDASRTLREFVSNGFK